MDTILGRVAEVTTLSPSAAAILTGGVISPGDPAAKREQKA